MDLIGERIKHLRKEVLNITQKDFGSQIGLKPNSVSDIESGKNNPTEQTLKAICREFNINYLWLTQGIEPMKAQTDRSTMAKIDAIMTGENKVAQSIFKAFANLDESEWELLIKIIKDVSKEL